ncbi:hypothetical protein B0J14DRAFT_662102 [Halenospora varia]|nr:hypothetical protein B0J14DRAFT_662102 [Halenospora varia]
MTQNTLPFAELQKYLLTSGHRLYHGSPVLDESRNIEAELKETREAGDACTHQRIWLEHLPAAFLEVKRDGRPLTEGEWRNHQKLIGYRRIEEEWGVIEQGLRDDKEPIDGQDGKVIERSPNEGFVDRNTPKTERTDSIEGKANREEKIIGRKEERPHISHPITGVKSSIAVQTHGLYHRPGPSYNPSKNKYGGFAATTRKKDPEGIADKEWEFWCEKANLMMEGKFKGDKAKAKAAREDGCTRDEAIKILLEYKQLPVNFVDGDP